MTVSSTVTPRKQLSNKLETLHMDENVPPLQDALKVLNKQVEEADVVVAKPKEDLSDEPLLTPNPNRFVLFPIKYHDVRR